MQAKPALRPKPNSARITSWARLWLACIATLLSCAAHLLPPAHRRRLPLLNLRRGALARCVARLIFICALERATAPALKMRSWAWRAGMMRALMRAGIQRHLTDAHGAYDLAQIARTCADPDAAIADMAAVLETGLTPRTSIPPRAAHETLHTRPVDACAFDTS